MRLGPPLRRTIARYSVAVLAIAITVAVKLFVYGEEESRGAPFLLMFIAVTTVAWYGGIGPALLAIVLGAAAGVYFMIEPYGTFHLTGAAAVDVATFAVEASLVSAMTVAMRSARAEAVRAETALRRENRAHRALSACNEVVVRAKREDEMLRDVCAALVDVGRYRMAWVGWAEHDEGKTVRPTAHAGVVDGYLDTVNITWADVPRGRGPTGTAIRTGRPCVRQNLATSAAFTPWRAEALRRGYAASIGLPLWIDEHVAGAITIYASEPDAFDDDEVRLLVELADDTAYGVTAVRARTAAVQATRAKTDFLRVVSHELRTPLTPLIGWAQVLSKHAPRSDDLLRHGLDVILRSARAQAGLVDDVLAATRFAAGEGQAMTMERTRVGLASLLQECLADARAEATAKRIGFETRIDPNVAVFGDAGQLLMAIRKIIGNALKFTASGGRISVEIARDHDRAEVRVRDTGKGIVATELPHVFEPFRSGDPSTTRREGGLGVGLFLARQIVEALGGTIRAESEGSGRGTMFLVTLPSAA